MLLGLVGVRGPYPGPAPIVLNSKDERAPAVVLAAISGAGPSQLNSESVGRTKMTQHDQRVADFLVRHRDACVHVAEVERQLSAGVCQVTIAGEGSVSCQQLLDTYRIREQILSSRRSVHATTLREAVRAFCRKLEHYRSSSARIWSFDCPEAVTISVFEEVTADVLLGCLRSYDQRELTPERFAEIWGPEDDP